MAWQPDASGLELLGVPAEDPVRVPVRNQLAVATQGDDPRDERQDLLETVLDQHHGRRVALDDPPQQVYDHRGSFRVEVRRWLVEQNQARPQRQHAGDGQALLLAAR